MINYCLAHDTEWTSRRSAVEDRIQNCTTVLIVSIVTYWPLLLFNYVTEILQKWKMSTHIYQLISPSKQWYFTGAFFTPNWQQWRNKHKTNINNKKICTQRVQTPPRSLHCWRCCSGKDAGPAVPPRPLVLYAAICSQASWLQCRALLWCRSVYVPTQAGMGAYWPQ